MRRRSVAPSVVLATLVAALGASAPTRAAADPPPTGVIDRIVAVVGRDILLLSDLRAREKPSLLQIEQDGGPPDKQAAARAQMEKELVAQMVDERLVAAFAAASHVVVTPEEIDRALDQIAQQNGISVEQVDEEARKRGVTHLQYRALVAQALLEGKLLQTEVRPRIPLDPKRSETEFMVLLEKERAHWLDELKRAAHIDIRL